MMEPIVVLWWVHYKIGGPILIGAVSGWVLGLRKPVFIEEIMAAINAMLPTHGGLLGGERKITGCYADRPQPAVGNAPYPTGSLMCPSGAKLTCLPCSVRHQFIRVPLFRV